MWCTLKLILPSAAWVQRDAVIYLSIDRNRKKFPSAQAATIASYKVETIRNHFTRLLKGGEQERGIKIKMRVKLAAKLLVIAWTLMKRNEAFDRGYFKS
jgi:hypothetical protein